MCPNVLSCYRQPHANIEKMDITVYQSHQITFSNLYTQECEINLNEKTKKKSKNEE